MRILLLFIILFVSCGKKENTEDLTKPAPKIEKSFSEKLKTEPKIFLKFWENMSHIEYLSVIDTLKKEGVLNHYDYREVYYLTDLCKNQIKAKFENDKLKSISLVSDIDCVYDLYSTKYNLPKLKSINLLFQCYTQNNNDFELVTQYKKVGDKNKILTIPNSLIDKTVKLRSRVYHNIDEEKYNKKYISKQFYKDEFIVEKENIIIAFEQNLEENIYPYKHYSLYDNKDAKSTQVSINGQGFGMEKLFLMRLN